MNAFLFCATGTYANNNFLFGVVWINLSPHVFLSIGKCSMFGDIDHPARCVLCAVLHRFCTGYSERRLLVAAFGSALSAADVDHPVHGVWCAVLRHFRTGYSE